MEKTRRRICQIIGLFGVVAVGTSIAAEFTRTKKDEVRYDYRGCRLPGSAALPLGITAAISLSIAQITANVMAGCGCCCTRNSQAIPSPNRFIAIVCLILSWTSFVFAMLLLIAGCALNQRQGQWLDNECYVVKGGVLGGAGTLSFATTVLAMIYYAVIRGSSKVVTPLPALNSGSLAAAGVGIELNPSGRPAKVIM